MIDNSSAFRRDPEVPLVVSEVNPHALEHHHGLIANPNCSTMELVVALAPIHRAAGIERLVVSTYQSVSGTGKAAIDELDGQAHASLHGMEMPAPEIYPEPIGFNVIGAAGSFADGDDHTDEERKMMFETRKILEDESIGVAVTCVRVPVRVSHSLAVNVQTREPLSAADAQRLLARRRASPSTSCRRRSRPRGATTCSSGASATTSRIRAHSACGSSATTCARARRPTPSRSPRLWARRSAPRRDSVAA